MTTEEKLAAILAAIQTDPGNRGLKELFVYCPGDFAAACRNIAGQTRPHVEIITGFFIPGGEPPTFETDGPLGTVFLAEALEQLGIRATLDAEGSLLPILTGPLYADPEVMYLLNDNNHVTHTVWIERAGPGADGRCRTMRGRDISDHHDALNRYAPGRGPGVVTIGIGDGGNEIGMGKIPHEIIVNNIPNGDLIHCRVQTDHLIVAGVSNWGAYALAAGVYILRGVKPPADLFDPDREREILEVMVREGPLVDGVTGKQTATVDGLTWEEYVKPLIRIREILES